MASSAAAGSRSEQVGFAPGGHGVFVNYRVGDQETTAALIADVLRGRFGRSQVFFAGQSLRYGSDFADGLVDGAGRCSVLVAVIGPGWPDARGPDGTRRLDSPDDWVRREIELALETGRAVLPVLVGDRQRVPVPTADVLPPSLAALAGKHYLRLDYRSLDLGVVVEAVLDADPELALGDLWAPPAPPPPVWTPANLLRADYEVVPFAGRSAELAAVREWRDHPAVLAARVITGVGGQGKSRLGRRAVEEAREAGWSAGIVAESVSPGVIERLRRTTSKLFLLVDYAEGRLDDLLRLTAVLAERSGPARLLLLSRFAGEWRDRLTEDGDERVWSVFSAMTEQRLDPLKTTAAGHRAEFRRAVDAFAHHVGDPTAEVPVPPRVEQPDSGTAGRSVLDLHATALAGLLDVRDSRQPATGTGPLARVLDHERRYWRRTLATAGLAVRDERPGALVAAATLFTAPTQSSAEAVAQALAAFEGDPKRVVRRYIAWAAELYPGPDRLNPVLPDRVGEELVAAVLRRQPDVLIAPLAHVSDRQAERGLLVTGRALSRHASVAEVLPAALKTDLTRLVLTAVRVAPRLDEPTAFAAVVKDLLDEEGSSDLVGQVLAAVPGGSVALADVAVLATELTLANAEAHAGTDPVRTAHLLRLHSIHLAAVGRRADALAAIRRAVDLLEEHGAPAALASALVSLADRLGPREDRGSVLERAVGILRDLPGDHRYELASALQSEAIHAHDTGRFADARDRAVEAVALHRALDDEEPGAYSAQLASCLLLLATCHAAVGDWAGQKNAVAEVVRRYRVLADRSPDSHLDSLAAALSHDARLKLDAGDAPGALAAGQEGLEVRRRLASRYPEVYREPLARSLEMHALVLQRLGRDVEAVAGLAEAVHVLEDIRDPADLDRRALLDVQASLVNLLVELDRGDEAVDLAESVVDRRRALVATAREAHLPDLARALLVRSSLRLALGEHDRAARDAREAAGAYQELADRLPDTYKHFVARALNAVAVASRAAGRPDEAITAVSEAIGTRSAPASADPDAHRRELASAYANLGTILDEGGDGEQSLAATGEAFRILSKTAGRGPADRQRIATVASTFGVRLAENGRAAEGHRLSTLAVNLVRPLVEAGMGSAVAELALALDNSGMTASAAGHPEAGLEATRESVALRTGLAVAHRRIHLPGLANAVYNLSIRLADVNRLPEAAAAAGRAVGLYRELAEDGRVPETSVALALLNHAGQSAEAGENAVPAATEAHELYAEADAGTGRFARQLAALRGIIDVQGASGEPP